MTRPAPLVVVMGVSASGKTSVARLLARRLSVAFLEGDALHPAANVAKMARGEPLNDADRAPWLDAIHDWIVRRAETGGGGAIACSALKRAYRDRLRQGVGDALAFVLLDPPRAALEQRLVARRGHFMPAGLLDSQIETLERPGPDERSIVLTGTPSVRTIIRTAEAWLGSR